MECYIITISAIVTTPLMKISSQSKLNVVTWPYCLIGLVIGLYQFFHAYPDLSMMISPNHDGGGYWYRIFSESIFKYQNIYLAESILLPLIAKVIGANLSVTNYQVLCGFLTILIMPCLSIALRKRINSSIGTLIAIVVITFSYDYLYRFELGFPDPLTIILLTLLVASNGKWAFLFSFLAALSHFSISCLAIFSYLILSFTYKWNTKTNYQTEKLTLYGLMCGKLFLILWGYIFHYHLNSRINFVLESGFNFFWARYLADISLFWLTPGIIFLIINLIFFLYFIFNKKISLCIAQLFLLSIAYLSLFITVDGLRVFAVVIIPGYLFLIIVFINDLFKVAHQYPEVDY